MKIVTNVNTIFKFNTESFCRHVKYCRVRFFYACLARYENTVKMLGKAKLVKLIPCKARLSIGNEVNSRTALSKSVENFKNTGENITTPIYQAPVTTISFWVNAFSASVTEVGHIDLEAWNGTEWVTSEEWRTQIQSTTKRKTIYISFAAEDNYTQFRLTFTDNGGSGIAFDAFTATCSRNITYIY